MVYPTVSAMLTVLAPASMTASSIEYRYSMSVRVASIGENSTSSQYSFARSTDATAISSTCSGLRLSWCMIWTSELEMKTWILGRSACSIAPHAASTSGM